MDELPQPHVHFLNRALASIETAAEWQDNWPQLSSDN